MNRRMKDSGVEWIGKIPEGWKIQNLKSILVERNENNNPVRTDFILSLTKDRGVIPYTEKGDIGNKSKDDISNYKLAYPGDIVLNSMNVIIGSVGLSRYFGAVSPVYYTLHTRLKENSIEYYNLLFQTETLQKKLVGYGNGILPHRMRIPMINLNTVLLPYPDSRTQHQIATYLDQKTATIDHIIEKTKASIEDYKLYKQSLISEAVTKGLDPDVKLKDSGVEWIGEIPEHWAISKIKHVADFAPNLNLEFDEEQPIGYVPMDRVKSGYLLPGESLFQNLSTGLVPFQEGDIVMAKVTPCFENGNIAVAKNLSQRVAYGSSELFVFRSHGVDTDYLYYFLQTNLFKDASVATMTGTGGLKRVSSSFVRNAYLPMPSVVEQKEISSHLGREVRKMEETIIQKEQLIEDLEAYKKSLIYEVVTGKREVQ